MRADQPHDNARGRGHAATPPGVYLARTANNEGFHQEGKTADDATAQHPQFACRTCVAAVWPSEGVDSPRSGVTPH